MSTIIYIVSNAPCQEDKELSSDQWSLSYTGKKKARILSRWLHKSWPKAIYSSPWPKAIQTVQATAKKVNIEIVTDSRLRERNFGPDLDNFSLKVRESWKNFDYRPLGGETSLEAKKRVTQCVRELAKNYPEETIIISTHPFLIGMLLSSLVKDYGHRRWSKMLGPDCFRLIYTEDDDLLWDQSLIYAEKYKLLTGRRRRPPVQAAPPVEEVEEEDEPL